MIIGRKIETYDEKERLEAILRYYRIKECNDESSIVYVLEEDGTIIGGCRISLYNDIGVLKYIVIDNKKTGEDFGDGLLRATLNYCYLNGVEKVYYSPIDSYLLKEGFTNNIHKANENELYTDIQNSSKLICIIDDFFSKGCRIRRS